MDIIFAYVQEIWQYVAMMIALIYFFLKIRRDKIDARKQREEDQKKFEDELKKGWEAEKLAKSNEHRISRMEEKHEEFVKQQHDQKRECDLRAKEAKDKDDATRTRRVAELHGRIDKVLDDQCEMKQNIARLDERTRNGGKP